jgi:predicted alpha/beta superfamily hydrolase
MSKPLMVPIVATQFTMLSLLAVSAMTMTNIHAQTVSPSPSPAPALTITQISPSPQVVAGVVAGKLERLEKFPSTHVDARNVDVWLPPNYTPSKRYAVLYMHDGQMLFDPKSTWNKQAWQVDVIAAKLMAENKVRDFIIVGIWNNGKQRHTEYYPEKFLPHLPQEKRDEFIKLALNGKSLADAYLRFIVEELKPAIDKRYSTVREPTGTFVMGASMGGLISAYALLEYPLVFGAAAAMSPHWIAVYGRNDIFPDAALAYMKAKLPAAGKLKLYMDRGTIELDEQYDIVQPKIDALIKERGHVPPNIVSRVFEGAGHNETAWRERLEIPLLFLLGR